MRRPYKSSAWAYLIDELVCIGPHLIYRGLGGRREGSPVHSAKLSEVDDLAVAVESALREFKDELPPPFTDLTKGIPQPVLRIAKVESFNSLLKIARYVDIVEWPDGRVEFCPSRNSGPRLGYTPIFPNEIAANRDDFAHYLRRAFDRCE